MRCVCCDYTEGLPSVFQSSLPEAPRKLKTVRGEVLCNVCRDAVRDTVLEDREDTDGTPMSYDIVDSDFDLVPEVPLVRNEDLDLLIDS